MYMIDLPGKPGKSEIKRFANSVTVAIDLIRRGDVASTAGDHGSINAYRDNAGKLRAQRCVYCSTQEDLVFKNLKELASWYRLALRRIK